MAGTGKGVLRHCGIVTLKCGLVASRADKELGQQWLLACCLSAPCPQPKPLLALKVFCGIHPGIISQEMLMCLTHWGRDKMAAIFQTAFSWMKMYEFRLRFHCRMFPRVQLTIFMHWFRKWLGAGQATSHYLNQWWLVSWRIYTSLGLNELNRIIYLKMTHLNFSS